MDFGYSQPIYVVSFEFSPEIGMVNHPTPPSQNEAEAIQSQLMATAFRNPMVPKHYGNMMVIGQSASDVSIIVATNGNPTAVLSMSFVTAKSLIEDLATAISTVEKAMGTHIPSIQELGPKLQDAMDPSKNVKI